MRLHAFSLTSLVFISKCFSHLCSSNLCHEAIWICSENTNERFLAAPDKSPVVWSATWLVHFSLQTFLIHPTSSSCDTLVLLSHANWLRGVQSTFGSLCGRFVSFAQSGQTAASVNWTWTLAVASVHTASWCSRTSPQTASSSLSLLQAELETLVWLLVLCQGARVWLGSDRLPGRCHESYGAPSLLRLYLKI